MFYTRKTCLSRVLNEKTCLFILFIFFIGLEKTPADMYKHVFKFKTCLFMFIVFHEGSDFKTKYVF
jgi:hypothetical protein